MSQGNDFYKSLFYGNFLTLNDGSKMSFNESHLKDVNLFCSIPGYPDLINYARNFQKEIHNLKNIYIDNLDICAIANNREELDKIFKVLVKDKSLILVESPTNETTLSILERLDGKIISVLTDEEGMIPQSLSIILESCYQSCDSNLIPYLLYTCPTGNNPTGRSCTLERKKNIYEICRKYNILIIEDDPNYFLSYSKSKVPSYLSMDENGMVLRIDSFRNSISYDLNISLVTGPKSLIERLFFHSENNTLKTIDYSQIIFYNLLQILDNDRFENFTNRVVELNRLKKDAIIRIAKQYLRDLAEWEEPDAGIFLWIKLKGIEDSKLILDGIDSDKMPMFTPGGEFHKCRIVNPYVRVSFNKSTPEETNIAFKILADILKLKSRAIEI